MESQSANPIVAIVGQTASGKSELAMRLAKRYNGEIICADSRTVYKYMDIGTAKPTPSDQAEIPHHGLDLITPDQTYSAADFKYYAQDVIKQVQSRNRLPLIVGGTGLYVDGLVYGFEFSDKADPRLRQELESLTMDSLHKRARELGITENDINFTNRRHLQRAVERGGMVRTNRQLPPNVLLLGVRFDKPMLEERIQSRVEHMFERGFLNEVKNLIERYGAEAPGLLAPGYKEFVEDLYTDMDEQQLKLRLINSHKHIAKRQKTWFKRNPDICWISSEQQAIKVVKTFLSKFATIVS